VFAYRHNLPVLTVAVLLHPGADSPQVTGLIQRTLPEEDEPYTFLRYRVIRVWLLSAEQLLKGGLGTLPLAPISNVTAAQVPEVVRRMKERLAGERNRRRVADMWAATYVLLGLRYSEAFADALLQGIVEMEESATYRALVAKGLAKGLAEGQAKGRAEEARRVLLMLGEEQLGPPSAKVRATIAGLEDVNRLERLLKKLRTATSWQDLLGSPAPRRNNDRRSKP
jgi:predicted transposase YdaD